MGTSSENLVDDSDTTSILNPVTAAELKGWYSFGFATEGYAALAIAIFFPIILEGLAANVAVESLDHSVACNVSVPQYDCSLEIGSNYVPTTSLVFYATTISVLIQFIVFISLGALADHGTHRKQFLMFFGYMTSIIGFCTLFVVSDSLWWMAFLIYILSNITFGASFVFFYAWVPILTRNDSRVIEASALSDTATYYKVSDTVGNEISSKGFAYGYLAAFVQLVIASGFAMLFGDGAKYGLTNYYGLQIGVAFSSVWAAVILWFYTQPLLDERPGPPLPPGENYILFSYKKLYGTLSRARQLPQLFKFLLAWFIYSDGFSTIVAVAILFAKNLGASTPLLLLCGILAPLAAGVGSVVWPWIQVKIGWKTRHILILHALLYTALPLYGILFFNNVIEVIPLSIYHGFLLGATQSSCRVLFSELMPPGLESEFFGLYEITDKGSAWIGPLVIGLIRSATGNLRNGFYFLGAFLLIPAIVFYSIDEHKGKKDGLKFIAQNSAIPMTNLDGK